MNNRILLSALALIAGVSMSAAADIPVRKDTPPVLPTTYNGFYIGITGGAGFANRQTDFITLPGVATGDVWPAGIIAGMTTGYSAPVGAAIVQLEADWNYSFNRQGGQCAFIGQCNVQDSFLFDQGIWVGMPWGSITGAAQNTLHLPPSAQWPLPINLPVSGWGSTVMPKIGGGLSERNVKVIQSVAGVDATDQSWLFGWWAGVGLDMPVANGWLVSAEWKYHGFNKSFTPASSVALFGPFAQEFTHLNEQTLVIKAKMLF